jgi:hypothetical protein
MASRKAAGELEIPRNFSSFFKMLDFKGEATVLF